MRDKDFYKFQNKVLERLSKTEMSPNEHKYCWLLFRETLGYGKYETKISRSRISDLTGMAETTASDVKKRLVNRNIIHTNISVVGFKPNISKWEKVKVSLPFEKVKVSLLKGQGRAEKKGQGIVTLRTKKKENSKKGRVGLRKLSYKETDKLEGKNWLRQVMWQRHNYKEKFIDQILNKWEFEACYDVLLSYEESHGVRDKEAWFLAMLERGPAPEE
jgi:phage replication O-like protein O